jgi:hypothetical protein
MKYAFAIGSGALMFSRVRSFIKIGLDAEKLVRYMHRLIESVRIARSYFRKLSC